MASMGPPLPLAGPTGYPSRMEFLEGRVCILAALEAKLRDFHEILIGPQAKAEKTADVLAAAKRAGVAVRRAAEEEIGRAAHGKSHGGLIAVVSPRPILDAAGALALVDGLERPKGADTRARPYILLLDGVDDPRNFGQVLRTADALGVHLVIVRRRAWDFDATEVSRASSGAYERIPLGRIDREGDFLPELKKRGIRICGAVPRAQKTLWEAFLGGPVCLAIGGEKRGLSPAFRDQCDRFVTIPMTGAASSLSLTHAAAILMGEVLRQRQGGRTRP